MNSLFYCSQYSWTLKRYSIQHRWQDFSKKQLAIIVSAIGNKKKFILTEYLVLVSNSSYFDFQFRFFLQSNFKF